MIEEAFSSFYLLVRPHLSILKDGEFELINNADVLDLTLILYRLPFSLRPISSAFNDSILSGSGPAPVNINLSGQAAVIVRLTASMNLYIDFDEVIIRNTWH
jgi:hypothetical protein